MKKRTVGLLLAALLLSNYIMAQSEFSSNRIGVGVVCDDLEASMSFYLDVIGMKKVSEFDVDAEFGKKSGLSDGLPFHVNVLSLDESGEGNVWKLMSFGEKRKNRKSIHIQDDLGMQYITLNVNSLQPFLKRFREHGIALLGETPVPLASDPKRGFVLVQAPEGTIIELIGPLE